MSRNGKRPDWEIQERVGKFDYFYSDTTYGEECETKYEEKCELGMRKRDAFCSREGIIRGHLFREKGVRLTTATRSLISSDSEIVIAVAGGTPAPIYTSAVRAHRRPLTHGLRTHQGLPSLLLPQPREARGVAGNADAVAPAAGGCSASLRSASTLESPHPPKNLILGGFLVRLWSFASAMALIIISGDGCIYDQDLFCPNRCIKGANFKWTLFARPVNLRSPDWEGGGRGGM